MKKLVPSLLLITFFVSCSKVPITGRNQLHLLPESQMIAMSLTAYSDFLKTSDVVEKGNDYSSVNRVSDKLIPAVEAVLKQEGYADLIEGYVWEVNLVESKEANAWCMPGGKIVVYTGILDFTKTDAGLAVVMGHEIAHAVARHGNERMSQGLLATTGYMALDIALANKPAETRTLLLGAVGVGTTVGVLLPFSRLQESEADRLGLIFMAASGYDPHTAIDFWTRMSANGSSVPEFLSTHPSDETRINNIRDEYMVEAMKFYKTK
ncbi:MAG: M48 family metallopeptidase [Bacteroidetes bacterium]|jgi:predicted Zn-dependent protease|nr:M48 family metallopeptidase [Bacteroidota bacterium]MBK7568362.1 M48 family metallopeptidase [Bacteroidota bacterium]